MSRYSLVLVTPPVEPLLTLAEVKRHVDVAAGITYHDAHLESLVRAAAQQAVIRSGRQPQVASYRMTIDGFPSAGRISLPLPPLRSVDRVAYLDAAGDQQTLATTVYRVLGDREPAEICLRSGQAWPTTSDEPDAVSIDYTVGVQAAAASSSSSSPSSPGESTVYPTDMGDDYELYKQGCLLLVEAFWKRDHGHGYEKLIRAAEAIFESYRIGDDFVSYGEE